MDEVLQNLIYGPQPTNVHSYNERLIQIVCRVMGTDNVQPGFQYAPHYVQFEEEIQFPTGHAISAFARRAHSNMAKEEIQLQREKIRRLVQILARDLNPEELMRKCFDVSMMLCLILEDLGFWAVFYLGTLIYDGKQCGGKHFFYYIDDVYEPPYNSEARGHSWVFTPAFPIIDLTAKFQPLPQPIVDNTPFPLLIETEDTGSQSEPSWYVDLNDPPLLRAFKKDLLQKEGFSDEFNLVHRAVKHRGPVDLLFIPMSVRFAPTTIERVHTQMTFGGMPVLEFRNKVRLELAAS